MKLKIENGLLYVDNQRFCFAEVEGMDGSTPTGLRPVGPRAVVTQYSADHGDILPRVADYGWIGARTGRRIVIGRVRSRVGPLPCRDLTQELTAITVLSSSDNFDEDGDPILPAEPFIHHYAGWEV